MDNEVSSPLISVVVPVYNTAEYLERCVNSLINQTFKDYEIVLVNDGSTDDSPEICRAYSEKYSFIKTVSRENGGLSAARNTGVAEASGRYITFVDSDDFVAQFYLEGLIRQIREKDADISVVGIEKFSDSDKIKSEHIRDKCIAMSGRDALIRMMYQKGLDTSACAILMLREFAEKFPFPVGKYHEDELTSYKYYQEAHKVSISQDRLYFYYQRSGSIMNSMGKAKYDELDAADNLVNVFSEDAELKKAAESKCFSDYCQVLLSSPNMKIEDPETYKKICSFIKNKRFQMLFDKNTRLKNKLAALALFAGPAGLKLASKLKGNQ